MAETKPASRAAAPQHTFVLCEGDRNELELYGVANINGVRMTVDEVRAKLAKAQQGVKIADPAPALDRRTK
jgi:hypothetical protein